MSFLKSLVKKNRVDIDELEIKSNQLQDNIEYTKEPTGFINPNAVVINYDNLARTVTLTGDIRCLFRGELVPELSGSWVSDPHPENPTQALFLKYNETGFHWVTTSWSFTEAQIAYLTVINGSIFTMRECHGLMQWQSHEADHFTIGTYRISGGDLSDYTLDSVTELDKRPNISECIIKDEDLQTTLPLLTSKQYTQLHLSSINTINLTVDTSDIINLSSGLPTYNQWDGSNFIQTPILKDRSTSIWIIAIPITSDALSQKYRFVFMQGQSVTNTSAEQLTHSPLDLNLGNLSSLATEFTFIGQIVVRRTGNSSGDWTITNVISLRGSRSLFVGQQGSFLTGVNAGQVIYDNTLSGLTATNVKDAIDELTTKVIDGGEA